LSKKIAVDPKELSAITKELQTLISQLEELSETLIAIQNASYYLEGDAKGQVELFPIANTRAEELIAHYQRLSNYVDFASTKMVETDQAIRDTAKKK